MLIFKQFHHRKKKIESCSIFNCFRSPDDMSLKYETTDVISTNKILTNHKLRAISKEKDQL